MSKEGTNRIVVYKLTEGLQFEDLDLSDEGYYLEYSDNDKKLFIQIGKESVPKWLEYLEPFIGNGIDSMKNKNSSFVLIVKHENDLFSLAGGYGYTALKRMYEEEFGLNVALRMINDSKITSINQRSMKGTTRQLFRTVAGYDPLFDRENYNRILKHVEGRGFFDGQTFRVSGRSSLVLRTTKSIGKVTDVIKEIKDILNKDEKIHFPRSYSIVKDSDTIMKLTDQLHFEFREYWENDGSRDNLYLEFDDPLV